MRLGLRGRLALAQVALVAVVGLAVASWASRTTSSHLQAELRGRLAGECDLLRMAIDDAGLGWSSAERKELGSLVRRFAEQAGARATVVMPDGVVVADSHSDVLVMGNHAGRMEVQEARSQGLGYSVRTDPTTGLMTMYVATAASDSDPVVRLGVPLDGVRQAANSVRRVIYVGTLIGAVLAALLPVWSIGALTRSLAGLAGVACRLARGELGARARIDGVDEIRELADALNEMATGLSTAIDDLRRRAARLELILSQMGEGVLVVAADETVDLMNTGAGELLECPAEAAEGRPFSEAVRHPELIDLARRAVRLRTTLSEDSLTIGTHRRLVSVTAAPLRSSEYGEEGVVITLQDVTERQRLLTVRQEFVANASHELRTPVAAIQSLAEVLEGGALADPCEAQRFVVRIVENCRRLTSLLDDMLALSRLDEAPGVLERCEAVSLHDLVTSAVSRLESQAERKGITLWCEAPEGLAALGSRQHLMAALANLVDNAVKFTPEGGRVEIRAERWGDDQVRVSVTDTGPGVPRRARERIFERFYRVDRGRSRELGGTGLGLSIVKHAVEQSGGRVWVESAPGGGACFVVTLPAADTARMEVRRGEEGCNGS